MPNKITRRPLFFVVKVGIPSKLGEKSVGQGPAGPVKGVTIPMGPDLETYLDVDAAVRLGLKLQVSAVRPNFKSSCNLKVHRLLGHPGKHTQIMAHLHHACMKMY